MEVHGIELTLMNDGNDNRMVSSQDQWKSAGNTG